VIGDALGIGDELEAEMARHVENYRCEWKATIDDPDRMRRFRTFVNSDEPDPNVVFVPERAQVRPAFPDEKPQPVLLTVGPPRREELP
jgi:nitrite reductase (NADH) large subunit